MALDLNTYLANAAPWQDRGPDVTVPTANNRPQVVVTARFRDGYTGLARGIAYAWTSKAVEVRFSHPDEDVLNDSHRNGAYKVWLPVADVTTDLSTLPNPPRPAAPFPRRRRPMGSYGPSAGLSRARRRGRPGRGLSPVIARYTAHLVGDELVLTMADGAVHSRIPIDDTMDAVEALERVSSRTMPVLLLWTVDRTNGPPQPSAKSRHDENGSPAHCGMTAW